MDDNVSPLIFTDRPLDELRKITEGSHCVVFTDSNCLRLIKDYADSEGLPVITMEAGEEYKTLETVTSVWSRMQELGCTRRSILVNFGGGVVTDLGGFAASTFKRGIKFVNIPTTLLAAVDASVGGKTGIDFNGFKNEIGVFNEAEKVIVSTNFFPTLPYRQILSGYAEMIKHGLLSSPQSFDRLISLDLSSLKPLALLPLLQENVRVKEEIVTADPDEKGIRRYLNLGHTAGHAIESLALKGGNSYPHGYTVAVGLVIALVLSHLKLGFPSEYLHRLASFVRDNYDGLKGLPLSCDDYPLLYEFMSHDKKNPSPDLVSFTLLRTPGDPVAGQITDRESVFTALDISRDLLGI